MKGIQIVYTNPRGVTTDRNEWVGSLGILNAISDEINRALCRSTNIEESRNDITMSRSQKIFDHRKVRRGFVLIEGR